MILTLHCPYKHESVTHLVFSMNVSKRCLMESSLSSERPDVCPRESRRDFIVCSDTKNNSERELHFGRPKWQQIHVHQVEALENRRCGISTLGIRNQDSWKPSMKRTSLGPHEHIWMTAVSIRTLLELIQLNLFNNGSWSQQRGGIGENSIIAHARILCIRLHISRSNFDYRPVYPCLNVLWTHALTPSWFFVRKDLTTQCCRLLGSGYAPMGTDSISMSDAARSGLWI